MLLRIASPEKTIFDGKVKKVTLPTEQGEITVLPNHTPVVTTLKPGIIRFVPEEQPEWDFVFNDNVISISTSKGMVFIDGEMVRVVTAVATASPQESAKTLEQMKLKLESNIKQLKQQGSIEEIEKSLIRLEKLNADITLVNLKNKGL